MGTTLFAPAPISPPRPTATAPAWGSVLARCFDRHGPAVYGLAQRVTGDAAIAARLTAEVFAGIEEVTDEVSLEHCVLTDVHRRAVAWVRTARVQPTAGITPDALPGLEPAEREVIAAAYFDGLTYSAIAERLGMPVGQVAALMHSGLRRLAAATPAGPAS